jgi:hypothetical protein
MGRIEAKQERLPFYKELEAKKAALRYAGLH